MRFLTQLIVILAGSLFLSGNLSAQEGTKGIPFQVVEQKPSFMGEDAGTFAKWVAMHIIYPEEAKLKGNQGRVTVQFTIKADGSVADVHVLKGATPDLDAEAVRVVSGSPKWEPGREGGEPVDVIYTYPVTFRITSGSPSNTASQTDSGADVQEGAVPFKLVEQKPSFRGGNANEFSKWVNSHLQYPESAKSRGISGRVTLQFTIKADGSVADVHVLKSANPDLDAEAVRVVSSSPKWEPGYLQGKPVDVTFTFPVIFSVH